MTQVPGVEDEISLRIAKMTAMVVGADGKGGSGSCVQTEDGSIAVLTAKHVLIECLRNTGELYVSVPVSNIEFQRPKTIRMDSTDQGDAALLYFNSPISTPFVPIDQWTKRNANIEIGQRTLSLGFPASGKTIEGKKISANINFLEDRILSINGEKIYCGINEKHPGMPKTLQGLSGGGIYNAKGEFLGIVIAEKRNTEKGLGELEIILPEAFQEIFTSFKIPPDGPGPGFMAEEYPISFTMRNIEGKEFATIEVGAQLFWSKTNPENKFGRVGRLVTFVIKIPQKKTLYPINIESLFFWSEDSPEARLAAAREEVKFFLRRINWELQGEDWATIKVKPMV